MIWVRRGDVYVMLFFKRIRSVSKARGIGVRLQEGFCIRPWANKQNREILKWVTPKADTDISSKKRTLPGWDREGILLASKFHTSKQWKRLSGGKRLPLAARAESESLFRGTGIQRLPYALPRCQLSPDPAFNLYGNSSYSPNFPEKKRSY